MIVEIAPPSSIDINTTDIESAMIAHSNVTLTIAGLPLHLIEIYNATSFPFTRITSKRQAKGSIIVTIPAVLAEGLGVVADSHGKIH